MVLKQKLLHLDSKFATYLDNNNNFSDTILADYSTNSSFYARHNLQSAIRSVRRIYLKSVEMPVLFNNIRSGKTDRNSSDKVIMTLENPTDGPTTYTMTLNESMVYNGIDDIITDLNTQFFNETNPTFSGTFSVVETTGSTKNVMFTSTDISSVTFTDTILSYDMLGFVNEFANPYSPSLWFGVNRYNVSPDNYLNIFLENVPASNNSLSPVNASFKLPIEGVLGDVIFYKESEYFEQYVDITDPNFVLGELTILIKDRWGNRVYPYGADYSMTLMIEYEE